jgi:hypothetical protein
MKNKIYIIILTFIAFQIGNAQSNYYYYHNNNKIFLNLDRSSVTLITENDFQKSSVSNLNFKEYNLFNRNQYQYQQLSKRILYCSFGGKWGHCRC